MSINPVTSFKGSENTAPKRVRRGVLLTSAMGTATAFGIIAHKQGFFIKNLKNIKMKDWALFKVTPKSLKIEEKEILALAGGSVLGGLTGGAIFDKKENFKAKLKEALNQILGNVAVPVAFVGGASRLYRKYETQILSKVPQITKNCKFARKILLNAIENSKKGRRVKLLNRSIKYINRALRAIPPVTVTGIALAAGIISGNRVSNFINEKLYKQKVDRNIKATDFAPHVDDLCLAITLMAPGTPVGEVIARTIPAFLTVPGYQTGIAQNK
ncbi:hypothetical protein J6S88_00910 [bacterium]|nr:hypothetical protein [bacterium]